MISPECNPQGTDSPQKTAVFRQKEPNCKLTVFLLRCIINSIMTQFRNIWFARLLAAISGGTAAYAWFHLLFRVWSVDPLHYLCYPSGISPWPSPGPAAVLIGAFATLLATRKRKEKAVWRCAKFLSPHLVLIPLLYFYPMHYGTMLATLAAGGFAVWGFAGSIRIKPQIPEQLAIFAVILLFAAGTAWGTFSQLHAYRSFYLIYLDWGQYVEGYLRLATGNAAGFWNYLVIGDHWNPLPNLLFTALLRLFPAPETLFFVSALAVYSTVPLAYALARACRAPTGSALGCVLLALFNPALSHQCLTLFYGYHPVVFLAPLLLLFFLCRARGNRWGMGIVLALLPFIQETAVLFYCAWGLYQLIRKHFLPGGAFILGGVLLYWILSSLLMPAAMGNEQYYQLFKYQQLGNNLVEVALSPFLRPGAFFGTLFSGTNLWFALSLALPLLPLVLTSPLPALTALPFFAGVALINSPELHSVIFQYSLEITTLLLATAVISLQKKPLRWRRGALVAALFLTLGGYFCYGRSITLGKYPLASVLALPDFTPVIEDLTAEIEPESIIRATERLRGHLVFDFPTIHLYDGNRKADYLMLDLTSPVEAIGGDFEAFRRSISADPGWVPQDWTSRNGMEAVLFHRREPPPKRPVTPPFIRSGSEAEFLAEGDPLPQPNPDFEVRIRLLPEARRLQLAIRAVRTPERDVMLRLILRRGEWTEEREFHFGHGLYPAWSMRPGQYFLADIPYPDGWPDLTGLNLKLDSIR